MTLLLCCVVCGLGTNGEQRTSIGAHHILYRSSVCCDILVLRHTTPTHCLHSLHSRCLVCDHAVVFAILVCALDVASCQNIALLGVIGVLGKVY